MKYYKHITYPLGPRIKGHQTENLLWGCNSVNFFPSWLWGKAEHFTKVLIMQKCLVSSKEPTSCSWKWIWYSSIIALDAIPGYVLPAHFLYRYEIFGGSLFISKISNVTVPFFFFFVIGNSCIRINCPYYLCLWRDWTQLVIGNQ